MQGQGQTVPAPIVGRMLVDTGATATRISEEAALELGLPQVDVRETVGVHGKQRTPVYLASFGLGIADASGNQTFIIRDSAVAAAKGLEAMFAKMGVKTGGKDGGRLIGLLGRDFLRHATFVYRGGKGEIEIIIDPSRMQKANV